MSFYLSPPKGLANVHSLEDTARQRLKCYEHLFTEKILDVIPELECLIEDSVLDRLGHYLFRLVAVKSNNFLNNFVNKEVKLLNVRLSCYGKEDLIYFLKKLIKHSTETFRNIQVEGRLKELLSVVIRVCRQMLQERFFEHLFQDHDDSCTQCAQLKIDVPFELCPDLLASRNFNIKRGYLQIICFQWKDLILSLYSTFLVMAVKEMRFMPKVRYALEDERIKEVLMLIQTLHLKNHSDKLENRQRSFTFKSFSQENQKFPLCMRNLYHILQKNNRLSHNARFDFSLYLKDIGLSMTDALTFWENAYSKQHASCSRCTHSWQENEKRYIYGIRHLYGLEGSRKNYNVKSCEQIQNITLSATEEGGCPFQHFDDDNLRNILKSCLPPTSYDHIEVVIYERKKSAKYACHLFLEEQLKNTLKKEINDRDIVFQDPAQYFLFAKSLEL